MTSSLLSDMITEVKNDSRLHPGRRAEPPLNASATLDTILDDLAERVAAKLGERMNYRSTDQELVTVKETAKRIGRSPGAVYQLIARGELSCVRHGRRVHVRLRELQNWIERDAS
jgi:excisionase family DNA binding protein